MGARWVLVAGPSTAAPTMQLTEARDVKISWKLTEPSSLSFTINARHPQAIALVELGTDVHLLRDGVPIFTGRVGATSDDLSDVAHTVSVTVMDTRAILGRRLVQAARTYTNADVGGIVRDLFIDAQVGRGAGLGIDVSAPAVTTGTLATREMTAGTKVLEELQALAGGTQDSAARTFDWDVSPGWSGRRFQLWAPKRGRDLGVVLNYTYDQDNPQSSVVTSLKRTLDPKDYATTVYVAGGVHTEVTTQNQQVTETRTRTVPVQSVTNTGAAVMTPVKSAATITRGTRTVASTDGGRTLHIGVDAQPPSNLIPLPRVVDNPGTGNVTYTTETYTVTYTTQVQVNVEVPNAPVTYEDGTTVWQLGVWATSAAYPDTKSQAELSAAAAKLLAELQQVTPGYSVSFIDGFWGGPDHLWLGDTLRLIVNSGRLLEDLTLRVTQLDLELGEDGQEKVALVVGSPATLLGVIHDVDKRLALLERQWAK